MTDGALSSWVTLNVMHIAVKVTGIICHALFVNVGTLEVICSVCARVHSLLCAVATCISELSTVRRSSLLSAINHL